MANPNQRVQFPFGDAFLVNTPALDRVQNTIYLEEKQRAAQQAAKAQALDDEFAKNMSGIRDADIPELTKAYGNWKLANQAAMKKKDGVNPEEQLQVLKKKADLYSVINGSKQRKQYEDEIGKGIIKTPDNYEDNATDALISHRKTPLSELKAKGLDAYDYKYKGTNTDFQKVLSTAAGQPKQVYSTEKDLDGGLQKQITPYTFGNTPAQYKDSILASLSLHKAGRDAAAIMSNMSPEVIKNVQDKYLEITPEKWQRMGVDKPQDLAILPTDSKAEAYAKHQAQLYAINNEPKEGTPVFRDNKKGIMDRQEAHDKFMEGMKQAGRVQLEGMREAARARGQDATNTWVDNYLDKVDGEATAAPGFINKTGLPQLVGKGGNKIIAMSPTLYAAMGQPANMILLPDGKYNVTYNTYDKDGKVTGVDKDRSGVVSRDDVKLALGYKATTKKQLGSEMRNKQTDNDGYSRSDLKSGGWTDAQIDAAVKAGKIKIN